MSSDFAEKKRARTILLIASLVSSLVSLDSNIVAVSLPTIAHALGATFSQMQWVVTAYVLPFAALLLAAGSFGDRHGRRRAAIVGQAVFAVASLLCGLSTSALMLNLARALQGVGASLLLTASLAIINHVFRGVERAKAYAFWGACLGIAITCGPIIGGIISGLFGWLWIFLFNLPICAVLLVGTLRVIPESRDPEATNLDYAGVVTSSAGLFFLTWAVIDGNALGWGSGTTELRLAVGVGLVLAFVAVERSQRRPMIDFGLMRSRAFAGSACAMAGYAAGAQVMIFYLPLYLQNAYGFAPMRAGVAMLPFALPMFFVPRFGARLAAVFSQRTLLALGLAVTATANGALGILATGRVSYPSFALAMAVAGAGAGLLNGETAKALQGAVPAERAGMASGISASVRFTSLLFGVAGLGSVLVGVASAAFAQAAAIAKLGVDDAGARAAAKRFAAGDANGALLHVGAQAQEVARSALRASFEAGFGAAAWTAGGIAVTSLLLTWLLLPSADGVLGAEPDTLHVAVE
jgi:EmrB/QacA subfamily drug resistance transporter